MSSYCTCHCLHKNNKVRDVLQEVLVRYTVYIHLSLLPPPLQLKSNLIAVLFSWDGHALSNCRSYWRWRFMRINDISWHFMSAFSGKMETNFQTAAMNSPPAPISSRESCFSSFFVWAESGPLGLSMFGMSINHPLRTKVLRSPKVPRSTSSLWWILMHCQTYDFVRPHPPPPWPFCPGRRLARKSANDWCISAGKRKVLWGDPEDLGCAISYHRPFTAKCVFNFSALESPARTLLKGLRLRGLGSRKGFRS